MGNKLFYSIGILLFLYSLAACKGNKMKDGTDLNCANILKSKIMTINAGDSIDLDLDCLDFDRVIILSNEVARAKLSEELSLSKESKEKIFDKDYEHWSIVWLNGSLLAEKIDFSPKYLMLDNLVGSAGYLVIERDSLQKLSVEFTGDFFVGTKDSIRDVKLLKK